MIVDCALYADGVRKPLELDQQTLDDLRARNCDGGFVWVGAHEPDQQEMDRLAALFGLHPLAVEDALTARQRPKVEPYDNMLFIVLKTLWYVDEKDEVETGQVAMFVGRDFVVTVRQGAGVELHGVRHDLEERAQKLGHGPSAVVYSVTDRIVDGYLDVVGELEVDVDEVESSVFSPDRTSDSERIYVLKREIAEVRRAVYPLRAPMEGFARTDYPLLHKDSAPFFRDISDHVTRASEMVDSLDQLLSSIFEAHNTRIQVQQNEDMRKISAWVAIGAACTVVAGVYGMNFKEMPELSWEFGYPYALGLMLLLSFGLYRLFKRSGWI